MRGGQYAGNTREYATRESSREFARVDQLKVAIKAWLDAFPFGA